MEKIKKKKWVKRLIITMAVILVIICLLFIFIISVRGAPSDYFKKYDEFVKTLDKDFIVPRSEILPNVETRYEIVYKMENSNGRQIRPMIINGRGLFPSTDMYLLQSSSKVGTGYMIICKQLEGRALEEEKLKFIKTETINGVEVNVNEHGYRFFIDDIYYSASRADECEIMSMEQLRIIVEDIIKQANEK